MNLLKKLKSLFQKSEGAEFKEHVKPGREKVKRNVGKEVFEKTGKLKANSDNSTTTKSKTKKKSASSNNSKSSTKDKVDTNNRSAIKKRANVIKYRKKRVSVSKVSNLNKSKAKSSKSSGTKRKGE